MGIVQGTKGSKDGRWEIGPQSKSDKNAFTRRMRLHQSWYRAHVLKVPYGTGPKDTSTSLYGNMLTEASAKDGHNFLTPGIFELAKRRIAEDREGVEPFRCLRNMLSSQPMCFNLFGKLALDPSLATRLARALWGDRISRVTCVRIEWAPEPAEEYLSDGTTFDAFIEYETMDKKVGFIGIETKLTEPFSQTKPEEREKYRHKEEYLRWMKKPGAPWKKDIVDDLVDKHNQLWRDHLLAWALLQHGSSKYTEGLLAVVYHPEDKRCCRVIDEYCALLHDETTFSSHKLNDVVSKWRPLAGDWLSKFEERYLLLEKSEVVLP